MSSRAREGHRAALVACALAASVEALFVPLDAATLPAWPVVWLDGAHAILAALVGLWLWRRRGRPKFDGLVADVAFVVVVLPFVPLIWIGESTGARLLLVREPMIPFQFLMVGISLLAPVSVWIAGGLLGFVALNAAGLWRYLHGQYPLPGVVAEPWMTLLFGGIAATFLFARLYRRAMLQRFERTRAEAKAMLRVSRLFLTLRDRANTPLQTIEFGVALLERGLPGEQSTLEAMRRALGRLRALSAVVAAEEVKTLPTAMANEDES